MKKIFVAFAVGAMALGLSSCKETWDENPVLKTHDGTIQADFLNEPVMKNQPLMITNTNKTGTFQLTCSQPDYGYAAVASYKVQVSLTDTFEEMVEITQTFYDCANINPNNNDVAGAIEKLSNVRTEEDLPLPYQKVYMRLRAYVEQSPENTQYISNVVYFEALSADYLAIWVAGVPQDLYVRGGMNGWGADPAWQFETAEEENSYILKNVTIEPGVSFKIADSVWSVINLGSPEGNEDDKADILVPGDEYQLTSGGNPGHLRVGAEFTGNLLLRWEVGTGNYYIVLDPTN